MPYEPTEWVRGTKITASKLNNIESGVESVNSEYTPTTWAEGDIVTATKLNNIEQGIVNASGGGGGDFHMANVTATFKLDGNTLPAENMYFTPLSLSIAGQDFADYNEEGTGDPGLFGTPGQMKILLIGENNTLISRYTHFSCEEPSLSALGIDRTQSRVISGDAEIDTNGISVWGDCELELILYVDD